MQHTSNPVHTSALDTQPSADEIRTGIRGLSRTVEEQPQQKHRPGRTPTTVNGKGRKDNVPPARLRRSQNR